MEKFKSAKVLARQLEASKKRMAKERDMLRELISDASALEENYDEAVENLDRAADALSQYV